MSRKKYIIIDENITAKAIREFAVQQAEIARHETPVFVNEKEDRTYWANYRTFYTSDGKGVVLEKESYRSEGGNKAVRRADRMTIFFNGWDSFVKLIVATDSRIRRGYKNIADKQPKKSLPSKEPHQLSNPQAGVAHPNGQDCDGNPVRVPDCQGNDVRCQRSREDDKDSDEYP